MTERKHTENGIEKALEELIKTMYYEGDLQRSATVGNALDLINRQKAEIERLKRETAILSENADCAFQDGLNEVQDLYASQIRGEVRAEAINEFAERLKENTIEVDVSFGYGKEHYTEAVTLIEIDNLVKEMLGEQQ